MQRRNTIQKDLILNAVQSLKDHPTAEEVYSYIVKDHPSVSKATVYRNLNQLAEDGLIGKLEVPGEADRYDHICTKHYHMRCVKCGRIYDVQMQPLQGLAEKISSPEGMEILDYDIIFKGICKDCRDKL